MALFYVLKLIFIVCFVSAANACRANIMDIRVTKTEVAPPKKELIISLKEVVLVNVEATIPAHSHDSVTIDALTCRNDKWKQLVISNQNFFLQYKDSKDNNTIYRFISTQKFMTPKLTSYAWLWLCELSTYWAGCKCNVVHNFPVKVYIYNQNETNDFTREKKTLHEYQGPAEPKQLTCGPKEGRDINRPRNDLHEDAGVNSSSQQANSANDHLEPTEKTFSIRNRTEPSTEPNSEQSRDQKVKNQMPTEKNDGVDNGVKFRTSVQTNNFKDVNNSSSHVGCGEASSTWLILSVASLVMFLVGLVTGVFCRRPRTRESEPKQTKDEHIYDEVDTKVINNRPPLPVPENSKQQAENIYNSPYDHTVRFQNQTRLL